MKLPAKREESRLNRAYACFAFLGLVTMPLGLAALLQKIGLVNFDEGSGGLGEKLSGYAYLLGMTLGGPILVGMLVASVYGIVRTLQFRHLALAALSMNTIVCGCGMILLIFLSDRINTPSSITLQASRSAFSWPRMYSSPHGGFSRAGGTFGKPCFLANKTLWQDYLLSPRQKPFGSPLRLPSRRHIRVKLAGLLAGHAQ